MDIKPTLAMEFQFDVLERKLKQKRQEAEHLRLDMLEKLRKALAKIALEIQFDEAYIFGSITRPGRFGKESDIDVGFLGLQDEDFFRMMSRLSMELEWEVDVIQLEGHRLAEKIKREGIRWTKNDLSS